MHPCSWIYFWSVTFTFLGVHLGLEKHPQTRLPSCMETSFKCEKRNGKISTFSFRLLKFTRFLERFLVLPDLGEGLPCVRSFGNVPSAAQWCSKDFPPAVAAAGLVQQCPGRFAPGKRAGRRSWGERPINTAWLQLCCSLNQVTTATVHSAKMSHPFTAQHWINWKSPTAPFVWAGLESPWCFRDGFDEENGLWDCADSLSSLPYPSPSTFQWLWNLLLKFSRSF